METIIVQSGETAFIPMLAAIAETGWSISGGILTHKSGHYGYAVNDSVEIKPQLYRVKYTVTGYESGIVYMEVGGTQGIVQSANGTYEDLIYAIDDSPLKIYSDGDLKVLGLEITSGTTEGEALVFSEKGTRWVGSYSFVPDIFNRYKDLFLSFKNGELWVHNTNSLRNNFYGQQFNSKVKLISNHEVGINKVFFNIKLDAVGNWEVVSVSTNATDQFPNGMSSRIPPKNLKLIDGKYWADFYRDMDDPRFSHINDPIQRKLTALMEGRNLQGNYMSIELECRGHEPMKLVSVAVMSAPVERNF